MMPLPAACVLLAATAGASAPAAARAKPPAPVVAAQLYVWTQHYRDKGTKLENNLDEALAATARAGFKHVQGWLSWYATPEKAADTAARLARHKLAARAAYAGGRLHDGGGEAAIAPILEQARHAKAHGLEVVVLNPDVKKDGAEKTDDELALQARNLDALGARLRELGLKLAIHTHDKEMRSGAREWHHILRHTRPENVGFCLDLHWVFRGGQDPYELVKAAGARIHDLHLRNSMNGAWLEELTDGDIDHARVAALLARIPYRGMYTVELAYEKTTVRSRPLEENLKRSRAYVKKVLGR